MRTWNVESDAATVGNNTRHFAENLTSFVVILAALFAITQTGALAFTNESDSDAAEHSKRLKTVKEWCAISVGPDKPADCDPFYYSESGGKGMNYHQTVWDVILPWRINDAVTVGAVAGVGSSEFNWSLAGSTNIDTDSKFGGVFAAIRIFTQSMLFVSGIFQSSDSDFTGFGSSGSYDTETTAVQVDFSHKFDLGSYWITPTVGFFQADADREAFTDTVFASVNPAATITVRRWSTGATVGIPFSTGLEPDCPDSGVCRQSEIIGQFGVFTEDINGITPDPDLPTFDDNYVGTTVGIGMRTPLSSSITAGGGVDWFDEGSTDGFVISAFINIDLMQILGK